MKQKRKLSSFTLSDDATSKLEIISNQEGINKSRMIEQMINGVRLETKHLKNTATGK